MDFLKVSLHALRETHCVRGAWVIFNWMSVSLFLGKVSPYFFEFHILSILGK